MWGGGEKLKTYALALFRGITQKHNAGFLLFLRERVGDHEDRVLLEWLVQIHQRAVRIDYDRFAGLAKTAAVGIFSSDDHTNAHKYSSTSSCLGNICVRHNDSMLRHNEFGVNETVNKLFSLCNPAKNTGFCVPEPVLRAMIPQVF